MRANGPFLLRKGDIIAVAQPATHAAHFAFVERTIQANSTDPWTASLFKLIEVFQTPPSRRTEMRSSERSAVMRIDNDK